MSLLDLFQPDSDGDALAEAGARWLTQAYVADATGFSVPMWSQMAASGWSALRLPEACGGLDLGLSSCLPLVAELGAASVREPIVESALIAAPLAARAAADADFLGGLAEGHRLCVLIDDPSLPVPGGNEITDLLIYDAERAELALCPASTAPGAVWLSMDGRRMADRPRPQSGTVLLSGDAAHQAVALARAERRACLATEGCGAMQHALGLTARYLSERQQFGQPLAQFQALQHRLADMLVELELTRSAAAILTAHDTPQPCATARWRRSPARCAVSVKRRSSCTAAWA
ncbi:acyl-CoA dehydrogenase family protein [Pararhodobacter zhoushanensis]|uniref:Acyl-CoA dehydrogenase family protein n=1 Tax=Pararhodobacter zhoushanensis TaxID=2479545 RepID=A0ABT3H5A3_9RHOB|nr:acyl-CoA dehydrogenase family protein [Pararhodobacter zhoushanensis]MCW1934992.1 acyl-CoA dehydrogenase family protein [Pararhodobacter zhoushanensis]